MKKYITKQSSIKGAGKGLFTKDFFKKGEVIGLAHVDNQPASEIGRNHNHNEKNPTAYSKKINNKRFIYASRNLKPGEEITTNYRMQPELEQPEDFMRKGGSVLRLPNKKNSKGYSRSLSATNKLFTQNFLFAKPKSRKNKVFDPNAKYYAEGGESEQKIIFSPKEGGCPEGQYWTGIECKIIPKNTKIVYSEEELAKTNISKKEQQKLYNQYISRVNNHAIIDSNRRRVYGNIGSKDKYYKTLESIPKYGFKPMMSYGVGQLIPNGLAPGIPSLIESIVYFDQWEKMMDKSSVKPIGYKGHPGGGHFYPIYEKPSNYLLGYNKEEEPIKEEKILNLALLKPSLLQQQNYQLQGNNINEEELELPNEEVESEYLEEGSPDTENAMEWVNKRKYNIDWNGIQIPYRLPRFRKPGSYGDLIKPGKKRYINLPTIESRNTAYLREEQDGGITKLTPKEEKQFQNFYKTLPNNLQSDDDTYDIRGYWDSEQRPTEFDYTQPKDKDGFYHAYSINGNTGEYLKSPAHPTFQHAVDEDRKIGYRPITNVQGRNIAIENKSIADPEEQSFLRNTEGPINYIEVDLNEDEIQAYKDGGYIVDDTIYAKGGESKCQPNEYWDGEKCVFIQPIMQNPSWQQEPVVNPAAYVSGYRGGNPKMYKYGFLNSDQGNIVGGGGFGFPKPGVHLSALGVVPTSSTDKQYFKGAYEASISKDIKNLNLGLGVNTAITGYPGENGFVRDPIKLQPKLNLKYNFEEGGALLDDYIEVDLDEDQIEEYRRGGYIVEEIDNYQDGGVYTVKGSKGAYKKVNGKWQVDWNKSGKYQPLSKGDVKARTAVLDKMAKPLYDKDYDEMVAYKNLSAEDKINKFIPKKEATKEDYESISNKLSRNYKPENTKLQSVEMVYPEKYVIGPGGGLAGLGMKASKAAFAFKPISYLPSVGKALTYHSVYDAGIEHVPNTVKLLSDKSKWNNDKSVDLFKNLFKITSTAAGFSKYDKLKYFNRARNVGQLIDKTTDANKDALKGTKMLKNFVTTFKKYGGQQF